MKKVIMLVDETGNSMNFFNKLKDFIARFARYSFYAFGVFMLAVVIFSFETALNLLLGLEVLSFIIALGAFMSIRSRTERKALNKDDWSPRNKNKKEQFYWTPNNFESDDYMANEEMK